MRAITSYSLNLLWEPGLQRVHHAGAVSNRVELLGNSRCTEDELSLCVDVRIKLTFLTSLSRIVQRRKLRKNLENVTLQLLIGEQLIELVDDNSFRIDVKWATLLLLLLKNMRKDNRC